MGPSSVVSIKAQASGTVLYRHVEQGAYVKVGTLLFEIADLAAYLASSESAGMTGQSILVDGGMLFV